MLTVSAILLLFVLAVLMFNVFFLGSYYLLKSRSHFENAQQRIINTPYKNNNDLINLLREVNSETGYKIYTVNSDFEVLLSSSPEYRMGTKLSLQKHLREYLLRNEKALNDNQTLYGSIDHPEKAEELIFLCSKLKKNEFLIITQPLQSLKENVQIAIDFFLIIGVVVLLLSIVLVYLLAKALVKPIVEITQITESISNMDFSKRYRGSSKDETELLGNSVNKISEKLAVNIKELNETNEKLKNEMAIQKKFLASVSHEFKTPVGLIKGYCELLQLSDGNDSKDINEITEIIMKESDRLNWLVNDILFTVRLSSGNYELKFQNLELVELIRDTVRKFKYQLDLKHVRAEFETPDKLAVFADKGRMIQVMTNLISNAMNHVNQEGRITISIHQRDDDVIIIVFNSGSVINEKDLPHLFDEFYRSESDRSRRTGGSGLGLSIVKAIVTAHDGKYGVGNVENGVRFWFTIPK